MTIVNKPKNFVFVLLALPVFWSKVADKWAGLL